MMMLLSKTISRAALPKSYNLILFIATFVFSSTSFCQQKSFYLKTNVLNLVMGRPAASVQYVFNDRQAIEFSLAYGHTTIMPFVDHYNYRSIKIDYRYYTPYGLKSGFYVGPYLKMINRQMDNIGNTAGPYGIFSTSDRAFYGQAMAAGFGYGLQKLSDKKFTIDFYNGFGYGKYYKQEDKFDPAAKSSGFFDFSIQLSIGLRIADFHQ